MTRKRTIPVSLILTTLNEAAAIPLFLDGVRNGSVLPAEVVVCDGGSTDDTVALLRRAELDLPLRVLEEKGASIARGRNIAIAAASCDVVGTHYRATSGSCGNRCGGWGIHAGG